MKGISKVNIKNLVLLVDNNYDKSKLNLDEWQDYLDYLCKDREYQKEAIRILMIYFLSKRYDSINDLVVENFNKNIDLNDEYKNENEYIKNLQLPNILSGVIDLATATGKSYVIYGIAQIFMCMGFVDRVLVLCPSKTIEDELTDKFVTLASDANLKETIPEKFKTVNPRIVNANVTVKKGDICIENIHAVYELTGSSIKDSFKDSGEDVLILSDEVHHAYNISKDSDIKKWKAFIQNNDYGFRYHIGFTGTAYCENKYFNDVIYRYSLREAMDNKDVKLVKYVDEDTNAGDNEKFQKIYHNHLLNQKKYAQTKPISILITKDINSAKNLYENFIEFLGEYTNLPKDSIEKQVLIVTSDKQHKSNIFKLKNVDSDADIQWIISVSMLTEGWDVKNVFQIVPWEDRAFNSKLLIAQVLGRGLRIPEGMNQPTVRVFNHSSWSKNIKTIVDEILENELVLVSTVLGNGDRVKYNFNLYNIKYDQKEQPKFNDDFTKQETFDISKPLELITDSINISRSTTYVDTKNRLDVVEYDIQMETKSINEIVKGIVDVYKSRKKEANIRNLNPELEFEDGSKESDRLPTFDEIKEYILESMKDANVSGDRLTLINVEKINGKFTGLLRKKRTSAGFVRVAETPILINTSKIQNNSDRYSALKNNMVIFYSTDYKTDLLEDTLNNFDFLKNELAGKQFKEINVFDFKTPLNLVVANKDPESKFMELLTKHTVSQKIDAWIKSRDSGFYAVWYILKRGSKSKPFNPDFFIKVRNNIIVIEVKADGDLCRENYSKMRDAKKHFDALNNELVKIGINNKYYFNMLSPCSFPTFEKLLIEGNYFDGNFNSELEVKLREEWLKLKDD